MKKLLSLISIAILSVSVMYADIIPVNFGPKIGFNYSMSDFKIKGANGSSTTYNDIKPQTYVGFQGGLFVRIKLVKKLYLQPEAYFAMKGGKFNYTVQPDPNSPIQDASQTIKINAVDVPILVGIHLVDLKALNIRFCAGPVASYIVSKDVKVTENGVDMSPVSSEDAIDDAIWAIQGGLGFDILKFTLDFRYELGLNDVSNTAGRDFKSNLVNVSIGWKIK